MAEIQACSLCHHTAVVVGGPIYVDVQRNTERVLVVECKRCRRWFCNVHGEPLAHRVDTVERAKGLAILGCPFDYDLALGSEDDEADDFADEVDSDQEAGDDDDDESFDDDGPDGAAGSRRDGEET
jgi:hypothetical protein